MRREWGSKRPKRDNITPGPLVDTDPCDDVSKRARSKQAGKKRQNEKNTIIPFR